MVIASARLSSTTMPVAAEIPPIIVKSATPRAPAASGKRQNRQIAVDRPVREQLEPGDGERRDEKVDQHEIGRKKPRRRAQVAPVVVLDHRDVELTRKENDRERREQRGRPPGRGIRRRLNDRGDPRIEVGDLGEIDDAAVEPPDDERADRQKRRELDDQLDGDGKDETVLMLFRIEPPRAEGDGEDGEHESDRQRKQGRGLVRDKPRPVERIDDRQQGSGDGAELQRDVGSRARRGR